MHSTQKVALITGSAKRIGRTIATLLHHEGFNVIIHYHHSRREADSLAAELNGLRDGSATTLQADLNDMAAVNSLAENAVQWWGKINLLVNNASAFFPTDIEHNTQAEWDELINTNLRAPYFLCSALCQTLKQHNGCIINLVDIHAQRALPGHPIYSIAKAGLQMMTLSLAKELSPEVRVNGVSPGPILWPETELSEQAKNAIMDKTLLKKLGSPEDIADAVLFLSKAEYITGQILPVDGGKSLFSH